MYKVFINHIIIHYILNSNSNQILVYSKHILFNYYLLGHFLKAVKIQMLPAIIIINYRVIQSLLSIV